MLVSMNATYEHPSLQMHVTPEQRDRAESWLKEAYADGRISESEFDHRIGQVLSAVTRKELNEAFFGLVQVPTPSRALGVHPAYQPLVRPETRQQAGRGAAGVAHFSVFFLWLFGPGLVFALSTPGTYARRGGGQGLQLPADLFDRVRRWSQFLAVSPGSISSAG